MSTTVDNRVVEMTFDNAQFQKGVADSIKSIDNLDKALKFDGADKGFSSLSAAAKKVDFSTMTTSLEGIGKKFNWLEEVGVGFFRSFGTRLENFANRILNTFTGIFGKLGSNAWGEFDAIVNGSFFQGWDKLEKKAQSMQTIMSATRDSGLWEDEGEQMDAIAGKLDNLMWYADETSYSFSDMTDNIGKFVNAGVDLDTAQTAMIGISNWAAMSGQGTAEASRAMYNLSQSLGTGHVQSIDWKSVVMANMATTEFKDLVLETAVAEGELTKTTDGLYKIGKKTFNGSEMFDQLKEGWFTNDVLMKTLSKYGAATEKINEMYNDISEETPDVQTRTIIRHLNDYINAADSASEKTKVLQAASEELGVPIEYLSERFDELAQNEYRLGIEAFMAGQQTKTLSEAIDATKDAASTRWMQIFEALTGDFLQMKDVWGTVVEQMYDLFVGPLDNLLALLDDFNEYAGNSFDDIPMHLQTVIDMFNIVLLVLQKVKNGFASGFGALTGKDLYEAVRRAYIAVEVFLEKLDRSTWIENFFKGVGMVVRTVFTVIGSGFKVAKEVLKVLLSLLGVFKPVVDYIGEYISGLNDATGASSVIKNVTDSIVKGIRNFGKFIKPVVDLLGKGLLVAFKGLVAVGGFLAKIIGGVLYGAWTALNFVIDKAVKLFEILKPLFEAIGGFLERKFVKVWEDLKAGWEEIVPVLEDLWDTISNIFGDIGSKIGDTLGKIFNPKGESFEDKIQKITNFFSPLAEVVRDAADAISGLGDTADSKSGIFSGIVDKLREFKDFLSEKWESGGKDTFLGVIDKIGEGFKKIKDFGTGVFDKIKEFFKSFSNSDKDVTSGGEAMEKTADKVNIFAKAFETLHNIFSTIIGGIKDAIRYLMDVIGGEGSSGIDILKGIGSGTTLIGLGQLLGSLSDVFDTLDEFIQKVGKIDKEGLTDKIASFADSFKSIMLSIAAIIAAFVLSVVILSNYSDDQIKSVIGNITLIMGLVAAFIWVMNKMNLDTGSMHLGKDGLEKQSSGIKELAGVMVTMAAAIFTISKAIKKLGKMDPKELRQGVIAVGVIFVVFAAFLKQVNGMQVDESTAKNLKAFTMVAAAVFILVLALKMMTKMVSKDADSFGVAYTALLGIILVLALFAKIAGSYGGNKQATDMVKLGAGLIEVGIAVKILVSALKTLGEMDPHQLIQGGIALAGIMLALGLFTAAMTKLKVDGKNLILLGVGLTLLSVALLLLVPTIAILGNMEWDKLAIGIGAVAAILLVFMGAAWLAEKVTPGIIALSAAFLAFGATIALIGLGINLLGTGVVALAIGLGLLTVTGVAGMKAFVNMLGILLDGIKALVPEIALLAVELFVAFVQGMATQIKTLVQVVVDVLNAIIDGLNEVIPHLMALLDTLLSNIIILIFDTLTVLMERLGDFIIEMLQYFSDRLPEFTQAAVNFILAFLEGMEKASVDLINGVINLVADFIQTMADAFNPDNKNGSMANLENSVVDLMKQLLRWIGDFVMDMFDAGVELIGELWEGLFGEDDNSVKNRINTWWQNIKQKLLDKAGEMWEVAKEWANSLWNNLTSKVKNFFGVGKNSGDSYMKGFEQATAINSPSKRMAKDGEYLNEGLQIGLKKSEGMVLRTADDMAFSVSDIFSNMGDVIKAVFNDGFNDPTIRPTLDLSNVISGANGISSLFDGNSIGLNGILSGDDNPLGEGAGGNGVTFIQNNYSPKSLSRLEIYRQTKNQLSQIKGVVNGA